MKRGDAMQDIQARWMERAMHLAKKGWGTTNPNPLVGAVIIKAGRKIGEGFHEKPGEPHAEVMALNDAGDESKGADMYVTLEPCSHYGRTPPCVESINRAGIARVIVSMTDPNPQVAGSGIRRLKEAGIEVVLGVLEDDAKELNEIFIHFITQKTPYLIYKAAMSLDGKTASNSGHSRWITGEKARQHVHWTRQRVSGIMIGIGTLIQDNPQLTVRDLPVPPVHPQRIVVDSRGKIPLTSHLLEDVTVAKTLVATTEAMKLETEMKLVERGVEVIRVVSNNGRVDLSALFKKLGERDIDSILLEGGGTLAESALKSGLINRIMIYVAPKLIGGKNAPGVLSGNGIEHMDECIRVDNFKTVSLGDDLLMTGTLQRR